jgi:hypothetical protein
MNAIQTMAGFGDFAIIFTLKTGPTTMEIGQKPGWCFFCELIFRPFPDAFHSAVSFETEPQAANHPAVR